MKVLLVRPPVSTRPSFRFPLGLGYIAAVLDQAGHQVLTLDLDALRLPDDETEEFIRGSRYDIFALSGMSGQYKDMQALISLSKRYHPQTKVIIGGVGFSSMPRMLMENTESDIGVIREGEETIVELLDAVSKGAPLREVKGIWYRDNGRVVATEERPRIRNLDAIPFPKWEAFDMARYLSQQLFGSNKKVKAMSMVVSRGCPYNCTFCFRDFGRQTFRRSAENILAEIKELMNRYEVSYISFVDELFNSADKYVNDFCDRLLDEKIRIKWDCRGRVDLVNEDLLKKMKRAGCIYMGFGVESANETILKNMKKKATSQQAKTAVALTRKAGIKVSCSFMIGMFGETRQTFQETVDFIKENNMHKNYGFFYTTPFPGTELYSAARDRGLIKDEERYIRSLGETQLRPYVNLTDMADAEFALLKREADDEIRADFKQKHPFWFVEGVFAYYRTNGFFKMLKRIIEKLFT